MFSPSLYDRRPWRNAIETQGTGLGLAIVRHVLLRHRATLGAESVPDNGSTFTVSFPANVLIEEFVPVESA